MSQGGITRKADVLIEEHSWGRLQWMVSDKLGNSETMTVGRCYIHPHQQNPPHYHPNCDEVLHVLQGRIKHRVNDTYVDLEAGDTISIPSGAIHNAVNVGTEEAIFVISFSSSQRDTVGE
ncbi:cupin domain-containing protein [Arthrobacter sp. YN]|uniref:cupin domain-containing protein n=1 Tax=Arthrobacter sp. YN TaxID=2020486 RepID=UPI000B5F000A|nr:cupin domain-containing protein [Arthrobacter sp. YN]ASN22066.1 cupin [Arthrobacter sp. YN]